MMMFGDEMLLLRLLNQSPAKAGLRRLPAQCGDYSLYF